MIHGVMTRLSASSSDALPQWYILDPRASFSGVGMQLFLYPGIGGWVPVLPNAAPYNCSVNRRLCQNKRLNNYYHPIPPNAAVDPAAGLPTTRDRMVCDACDQQGRAMAQVDKFYPNLAGATVYEAAESTVFTEDGSNHHHLVAIGIPLPQLRFGAHHMGRLCERCENTEIQRYWERRFAGARRQTEAQAGNTCKCEAFLRKRLCFEDRISKLHQTRDTAHRNAHDFLQWLYRDPTDNDKLKLAVTPPARAFVWARRHMNAAFEDNACRCGREIRGVNVNYGLMNNIPTPAAICTSCDGVIIDTAAARVTAWPNRPRLPRLPTLPPQEEQRNFELGRNVERA